MIRVHSVSPLQGFHLRVEFTDGTERDIDVETYLRGPVFEPVRQDRSVFEAVSVDPDLGVIVWPNGADIDPDVLYGRFEPAWAEAGHSGEAFLPSSRGGWTGRVAEPRPTPAYGAAVGPQEAGAGRPVSREFAAMIHRDGEGFYVGSVPTLPACQARAGTREELTRLMQDAVRHAVEASDEPAASLEFVGVQLIHVRI